MSASTAPERSKGAGQALPAEFAYDCSGLSFQERQAGNQAPFAFLLALVFGYLFLVGRYESWFVPFGVILSVTVAAAGALRVASHANDIQVQIGLVLLIVLAVKNAILIVKFAETRRAAGAPVVEAAYTGLEQRFRALVMTALAFILGVIPPVIATGAGARRSIGVTVFGGMLAAVRWRGTSGIVGGNGRGRSKWLTLAVIDPGPPARCACIARHGSALPARMA